MISLVSKLRLGTGERKLRFLSRDRRAGNTTRSDLLAGLHAFCGVRGSRASSSPFGDLNAREPRAPQIAASLQWEGEAPAEPRASLDAQSSVPARQEPRPPKIRTSRQEAQT